MKKKYLFLFFVFAFFQVPSISGADLTVAVVDYERTFMQYEKRFALQKELNEAQQELNGKLSEIEKALESKRSALETVRPGTEKYRELQLAIIELESRVEVTERQLKFRLENLRRKHMSTLLGEIGEEVAAYAKEKGIDLVLSKFAVSGPKGVPQPIVLYAEGRLDITDEVLARLNSSVEKEE